MTQSVLRPADVAFFREHGWWLSPPMLDDDFLADLHFGVQRYLAGERDWQLPISFGEVSAPVHQADYLSMQIREFRSAIQHKGIASAAAALAGTSSVRLFHDQLVTKPPYDPLQEANVGWHTDRAYWSMCSSDNMLTAWIAIDDVPEEKGPLAVWDGSHLWPGVETMHNFAEIELGPIERQFERRGFHPKIVILPMSRGQVSFHHCRLVHGGFANRTDSPRHGYAIHMQDSANRHVPPRSGSNRRGHINDLMCRRTLEGDPDYADPDIFPVLWP
jgi:hypothetical protein